MDDSSNLMLKILDAKERRADKQKKLIKEFKCALLSFTLNIPGPEKNGYLYGKIHEEGLKSLIKAIKREKGHIVNLEIGQSTAGMEAYLNVDIKSSSLKRIAVHIEDGHPLGRLFDFDVFDKNGELLSRASLGLEKRKCLLCDKDAIICARSRAHSLGELLYKIDEMGRSYFNTK